MYQLYRDHPLLVLSTIIINIALSLWCLYLDPIINFDGVIYTSLAQLFLDDQITQAFDYYSWPFYPLFIALVAKLFFLNLETAAFVLNTIFSISLTLAFICIVAELSSQTESTNRRQRILIIAAIVILFFPSISKYRSFVIRDFGYLSFYLWSLYFIFRFCATPNKKNLIGWLLSAGLSCLFRFEGIFFAFVAPYFLLLFGATSLPHRKSILATLSVFITAISSALLFWYAQDKYLDMVEIAKSSNKNIHGLGDLFLANIRHQLGNQPLTIINFSGLLLGHVSSVFYELIRRMALLYFIFSIYAYFRRLTLNHHLQHRIWLIYLIINLLLLISFSLSNSFLISRYTMASALTLLVLTPFAIDHFITLATNKGFKAKIFLVSVLAVLLLVSADRLHIKSNKHFIKSAGLWIKQHTPSNASVYSNNKLVIYYADRGVDANLDHLYNTNTLKILMDNKQLYQYDYVALIGDPTLYLEDLMRQTLWYHFGRPVKIIYGDDKRYAFIYKIQE